MIKYFTLLLFIGLAFTQDITIAVLDFEGKGVSQDDASILTDRLRNELFKTGSYNVLERAMMDDILKEQGFQQTGCATSECAVEVGNMLGVQQMIGGSIGKLGDMYTVSARVIDVETGEVLKSANYDTGNSISNLLTIGMANIASQLVGIKKSDFIESSEHTQQLKSQNTLTKIDMENKNIKILKVKKKISSDGSNKVYVTYQQKISYKPSEIMIDWLDTDGIAFDGDKKYTKSKVRKDEIRSVSFYIPNEAFDYKVWLKN